MKAAATINAVAGGDLAIEQRRDVQHIASNKRPFAARDDEP
jgi:hypothetical protein